MQFNILGPIEVADAGRDVALGGRKQRAALVVLVLHINQVVTPVQLVDHIWGEHPPREAVNALQTYISTLRRALEPDRAPREPARVLRSHAGGYLLAADPADVDATRFERLAGEGRALIRDGRPEQARDVLRAALELWRGPALGDFADQPFARPEAARLEEMRLVAFEDCVAADLALGEHATVIGRLQRHVDAEPLREGAWIHLILALYRAGRQADALAAYQRCRRTLDEQLGIEPGVALRQLELDVLQQSPTLDWRPAASGVGDRTPPPQPEEAVLPFLAYQDGDGRERVLALDRADAPITVGRLPSARLSLGWDERVSRDHARLESAGDGWVLVDDGSRNGSFVNDERVRGDRKLADGDVLRFGETTVTFRHPPAPLAAETVLA